MVSTAAPARRTAGRTGGELSDRTLGLIMLAPMTVVLLLLIGYPLVSSLILSLYRLILADVWKTVPNMTLLLLAGLQPIPDDLYEAADADGATRWQKLTHITLPLLRPVILVAIALRTIGAFRVFDIIYVLTGNGGPADSTKVISFYGYDQAFQYLFFGYGAAISWLITACMLVLIVIYMHWLGPEGRGRVKLRPLRRR